MKIAIVVHGRFHAFDLAASLIRQGEDVTVFTNYPARVASRFGLPEKAVRSFLLEGIIARVADRAAAFASGLSTDAFLHQMFGKWAAGEIEKESWDLVHCFSGVAEESLRCAANAGIRQQLVRGSSHILTQDRLLREEQERVNWRFDLPSPWMIERELREYDLAKRIIVLSTFARQSFLDHGLPAEKVRIVPLGVDTRRFQASPEVIEARIRRVAGGERLRVLFTGTASYRKGFYDFANMVRGLKGRMEFRVVGQVLKEVMPIVEELRPYVDFVGRQPHFELPTWYAQSDVFVFPTIEDGFAAVIPQALAGGMALLCTANCSGPDLIRNGENGWILPIRDAEAFIQRLDWCDTHRDEFAAVLDNIRKGTYNSDWGDAARCFVRQST